MLECRTVGTIRELAAVSRFKVAQRNNRRRTKDNKGSCCNTVNSLPSLVPCPNAVFIAHDQRDVFVRISTLAVCGRHLDRQSCASASSVVTGTLCTKTSQNMRSETLAPENLMIDRSRAFIMLGTSLRCKEINRNGLIEHQTSIFFIDLEISAASCSCDIAHPPITFLTVNVEGHDLTGKASKSQNYAAGRITMHKDTQIYVVECTAMNPEKNRQIHYAYGNAYFFPAPRAEGTGTRLQRREKEKPECICIKSRALVSTTIVITVDHRRQR